MQISLEQLFNLPRHQRAQIALNLLDSLEPNFSMISTSKDIEKKWLEESLSRLEAYQDGKMYAYSLEEVLADLESSVK